MSDCGFLIADC